jgi:hypothetical protein
MLMPLSLDEPSNRQPRTWKSSAPSSTSMQTE